MPDNHVSKMIDAKDASLAELSYEEYLYRILQKVCDARQENARQNKLRYAGFPYKKYIENLEIQYLHEDAQKKLKILNTLDFVKTGQNVILAGNPGTYITIGIGIEAFLTGLKVL